MEKGELVAELIEACRLKDDPELARVVGERALLRYIEDPVVWAVWEYLLCGRID